MICQRSLTACSYDITLELAMDKKLDSSIVIYYKEERMGGGRYLIWILIEISNIAKKYKALFVRVYEGSENQLIYQLKYPDSVTYRQKE